MVDTSNTEYLCRGILEKLARSYLKEKARLIGAYLVFVSFAEMVELVNWALNVIHSSTGLLHSAWYQVDMCSKVASLISSFSSILSSFFPSLDLRA